MRCTKPVLFAGVGLVAVTLFALATCVPCDRRPPDNPTPVRDAAVDAPNPIAPPLPVPRDAEPDTTLACTLRDAGDPRDAATSKPPKRRQVCFDEDTPVRAYLIVSSSPDC